MSVSPFPSTPPWFTAISTPTKSRLFRMVQDESEHNSPTLVQVATLSTPPEQADRLVSALNDAAWTGSTTELKDQLTVLPSAVAQSCLEALNECPDPDHLVTGIGGWPLSVISRTEFSSGRDLSINAAAAMDLSLQIIVTNTLDNTGRVVFSAALLSGDCETSPSDIDGWWPINSGTTSAARLQLPTQELAEAFTDERWQTNEARAYWLWVKDSDDGDESSATAEWIIEFLDAPLEPQSNVLVFIKEDDTDDDGRGFLSTKNRFMLWMSLQNISVDLDGLVAEWDDYDSIVRDDMPQVVHDQPREWWRELHRSAERLCEAARRGTINELVPRTVAEEALIWLATRQDNIVWAQDTVALFDLTALQESLPVSSDDDEWDEILGGLTGDIDVEIVWDPAFMELADPANPVNQQMRIGDYRPKAWHRLFERAVGVPTIDIDLT